MRLLDESVKAGLSEFDFWEMTIGEIIRYIKGYTYRIENQRRERAAFDYNLAVLIGVATVGQMSKSGKMPTMEEAYPELFKTTEVKEVVQEKKNQTSAARFLQFAKAHNASISEEK